MYFKESVQLDSDGVELNSKSNMNNIKELSIEITGNESIIYYLYCTEKEHIMNLNFIRKQLTIEHPTINDLCKRLDSLIQYGTEWIENLSTELHSSIKIHDHTLLEQFNSYLNNISMAFAWMECRELNYIQTIICTQHDLYIDKVSLGIKCINLSNLLRKSIKHKNLYERHLENFQIPSILSNFRSNFYNIKDRIYKTMDQCTFLSAEWGVDCEILYSYIFRDVHGDSLKLCFWDLNIVDSKKKRISSVAKLIQFGSGTILLAKSKQRPRFQSFIRSYFRYIGTGTSYFLLAHDFTLNTRIILLPRVEHLINLYELSFQSIQKIFVIQSSSIMPITIYNSKSPSVCNIELSKIMTDQISKAVSDSFMNPYQSLEHEQIIADIFIDLNYKWENMGAEYQFQWLSLGDCYLDVRNNEECWLICKQKHLSTRSPSTMKKRIDKSVCMSQTKSEGSFILLFSNSYISDQYNTIRKLLIRFDIRGPRYESMIGAFLRLVLPVVRFVDHGNDDENNHPFRKYPLVIHNLMRSLPFGECLRNQIIMDEDEFVFGSCYTLHDNYIPDDVNTTTISCTSAFLAGSSSDIMTPTISMKGIGFLKLKTRGYDKYLQWKSHDGKTELEGLVIEVDIGNPSIRHPCIEVKLSRSKDDEIIKVILVFGTFESCNAALKFMNHKKYDCLDVVSIKQNIYTQPSNGSKNLSNSMYKSILSLLGDCMDEKDEALDVPENNTFSKSMDSIISIFSYYII